MSNAKVTLTPQQAEIIGNLSKYEFLSADDLMEQHAEVTLEHYGAKWSGEYACLTELTIPQMATALYVGFEVEMTPEEKVREYYDISRAWVERKGNVPDADVKYKLGVLDGIHATLKAYGIKIEGVNA